MIMFLFQATALLTSPPLPPPHATAAAAGDDQSSGESRSNPHGPLLVSMPNYWMYRPESMRFNPLRSTRPKRRSLSVGVSKSESDSGGREFVVVQMREWIGWCVFGCIRLLVWVFLNVIRTLVSAKVASFAAQVFDFDWIASGRKFINWTILETFWVELINKLLEKAEMLLCLISTQMSFIINYDK